MEVNLLPSVANSTRGFSALLREGSRQNKDLDIGACLERITATCLRVHDRERSGSGGRADRQGLSGLGGGSTIIHLLGRPGYPSLSAGRR
jgi:hypothetical protein